jgi:hypothetical protein
MLELTGARARAASRDPCRRKSASFRTRGICSRSLIIIKSALNEFKVFTLVVRKSSTPHVDFLALARDLLTGLVHRHEANTFSFLF